MDNIKQKILELITSDEHDFWIGIRQAVLMLVDLIERKLRIDPRTSALRREYKDRSK